MAEEAMQPSIQVSGYWVARGTRFSPGAAERMTQVPFSEKTEPGEIGAQGRYRGKPAPEGWGKHDFIVPSEDADLVSADSDLLEPGYTFISRHGAKQRPELTWRGLRRISSVNVTTNCSHLGPQSRIFRKTAQYDRRCPR